jgi:hypothetical protein
MQEAHSLSLHRTRDNRYTPMNSVVLHSTPLSSVFHDMPNARFAGAKQVFSHSRTTKIPSSKAKAFVLD